MIVLNNGTLKHMSRKEFLELVFDKHQLSFIQSLATDMAELEEKVIALHTAGKLSGKKADFIICDDIEVQGHPEQINPVKNKPQIKSNNRTKSGKHPLPFYLGSRRRY